MGKTIKGKDKAARKTAAAKRKIARKCKGGKVAAVVAAFALAATLCGCSTAESAQPAKANTMSNTFDDCIIVVATHCNISNRIVTAEGTKDAPAVELFTQTQSLESTGTTDTFGQANTQTPTTDVKPDITANYAQGGGITNRSAGGGSAQGAAGVVEKLLNSLTDEGFSALASALANKHDGTITVKKKDGTTATAICKDGSCTFDDGTKVTAEECVECKLKAN